MNLKKLQNDPREFRNHLRIEAGGKIKFLGDCLAPFQEIDFCQLDDSWRVVVGQSGVEAGWMRAWIERTRGSSKTQDLATMALWAMFASRRTLSGCCAAADRDQAGLIKSTIQRLIQLNPWLKEIIQVQTTRVVNTHTGSQLEIISSDAPTSYGRLDDFILVDELCHWSDDRSLFDSLLSTAAKKVHCFFAVITNAGMTESWQYSVRESIKDHRAWYFSVQQERAPWISEDHIEEQAKLLPQIAFSRLWENIWSPGSGDALDRADIDRSITLRGPRERAEAGFHYYAGLDLALSQDNAALAIVGVNRGRIETREKPMPQLTTRDLALIDLGLKEPPEVEYEETYHEGSDKLELIHLDVWKPERNRKLDIQAVENRIVELNRRFPGLQIASDAWQASFLCQRLRRRGVDIVEQQFTGPLLQSMCSVTLQSFREGKIQLYDHPDLIRDLRNLKVLERSYGIRLDVQRTKDGHGDASTALALSMNLARDSRRVSRLDPDYRLIAV